ncbi:sulfatase-like hydrolase/transferase [Cohnella cellulosilytica]|uniref:Sulfatase-like hydrolase/transferase n=1 Tax=Cohnella cellulosilytica TaxID=986710 RepID=A0ABW2FBK5_9BACL
MNRKNIVIIMSDEQKRDTIGNFASSKSVTPHLDRLAEESVALRHCYTPYPLCCPARTSLWTGLHAHNHHVTGNWRRIRDDLHDSGLVASFRQAGYHTIYNGKWHVPGTTPESFHFEHVSAIPAVLEGRDRGRYIGEYREYVRSLGYTLHENDLENLTPSDIAQLNRPGKAPCGTAEIPLEHSLEAWQTERFLHALDNRPANQPFLAVVSYNAPHFPMIVPAPYDRLVRPEDVKLPDNFLAGLEGKPREVLQSKYLKELSGLSEYEWRRYIAHYLGLCALVDSQAGAIVAWLRERRLYDDTILVYLSDHGDMMGAHGLIKKGFPLHYEEALNVPLIIANAGGRAGSVPDALVSLLDVMPTLAALTGVELEQAIDGRSFAGILDERAQTQHRECVLAETFRLGPDESAVEGGEVRAPDTFDPETDSVNLSIRTDRLKYIFRYRDIEELYDLQRDPGENSNVAGAPEYADELAAMRSMLIDELTPSAAFLATLVKNSLYAG